MQNTYYIHINTNTLPHYLVGGIIRPANLIKNKENDFQNNSGNQIILSIKKWNNSIDCSIEVVLSNEECKLLEQISSDFFLFHTGLPISRIKNIHFDNKEKADTVIWNINNTVAFVPNWAIQFSEKQDIEIAEEYPYSYITQEDNTKELALTLKRFDRLLGGFAFLKVSPEINSNNNINFSKSYLSTLAFFNERIENDFKNNNLTIDDKFHKIFKGDSKIFSYLAKSIDISLVKEVAKEEGIELNSKFSVIDLTNIPHDSLTFKLAVLETYGKENSKSVEDLITGLLQKLNEDVSEEIALIFGLHVGYNTLRNYYKIENVKVQVKYDLNSKIDLYTIESIYQYAFKDKQISKDFDYLNIDFSSTNNKNKRHSDFKYITILNDYYPYKKMDYKEEKEEIITSLTKEIFNWFPSELFNINVDKISKKISNTLNPHLNKLIADIKKNSENSFNNEEFQDVGTKQSEIDNNVKKGDVAGKWNISKNKEYKKIVPKNEQLLFDDEAQIELRLLNAMELDKKFIPELKAYAENLKIIIPKGITKKNDIIKIILSNQN